MPDKTERPLHGSARLTNGRVELSLTVPIDAPLPAPATGPGPTRGPDFAAVNWFGTVYTFSGKQRSVVAALWRAKEEGYEWVSQEALLEAAESDCSRLRDLFRGHPAWGSMIVQAMLHGGPAGAYGLAPVAG